jgi:hypothetical protein
VNKERAGAPTQNGIDYHEPLVTMTAKYDPPPVTLRGASRVQWQLGGCPEVQTVCGTDTDTKVVNVYEACTMFCFGPARLAALGNLISSFIAMTNMDRVRAQEDHSNYRTMAISKRALFIRNAVALSCTQHSSYLAREPEAPCTLSELQGYTSSRDQEALMSELLLRPLT